MNVYEKYSIPWRIDVEAKVKYDENTGKPRDTTYYWVRDARGECVSLFFDKELAHRIVAGQQALLQLEALVAAQKGGGDAA